MRREVREAARGFGAGVLAALVVLAGVGGWMQFLGYVRQPDTRELSRDSVRQPDNTRSGQAGIAASGVYPSIGLYYFSNVDPTAAPGVAAPVGQLLYRTDVASIYWKSGTSSIAWTLVGVGSGGGTYNPITQAASTKYIEANFCEATQGGNSIGYTQSGAGAGFQTTGAVFALGHPCVLEMDTGTTNTGKASFGTSPMLMIGAPGAGVITWEADVQIPTLSTGALEYADIFGMSSVATTNINAAAMVAFIYDRGNTATPPATGVGNTGNLNNWIVRTGDASVYTEHVLDGVSTCDDGATSPNVPIVAGDWYKLDFVYNQTPGAVSFTVSHNGGAPSTPCVINTHIPSATQGTTHNVAPIAVYHIGVLGAVNRPINTDYVWFYNTGLTR